MLKRISFTYLPNHCFIKHVSFNFQSYFFFVTKNKFSYEPLKKNSIYKTITFRLETCTTLCQSYYTHSQLLLLFPLRINLKARNIISIISPSHLHPVIFHTATLINKSAIFQPLLPRRSEFLPNLTARRPHT